jgi:hypothetical protein
MLIGETAVLMAMATMMLMTTAMTCSWLQLQQLQYGALGDWWGLATMHYYYADEGSLLMVTV